VSGTLRRAGCDRVPRRKSKPTGRWRLGWGGPGWVWGVVAAGVLSSNWTSTGSAQVQAVRREAVSVEASPEATRRVNTVLELAAAGEWERALEVLEQLETAEPDALAEVEPRRLLRAGLAAQVLRTQFPAEVLVRERARTAVATQAWLDEGRRFEDPELLSRVWRRHPSSAAAPIAVDAQAQLAWRDGRLDNAAALWKFLEPAQEAAVIDAAAPLRIRTDSPTAAELAARESLLELFGGDVRRADELLGRFAGTFPAAEGWLAGREGLLLDVLREQRTFANRTQSLSGELPLDIGPPLWRVPLHEVAEAGHLSNRPLLAQTAPPPVVPVCADGHVYFADGDTIRAVRVADGEPAWPIGEGEFRDVVYGDPYAEAYPYSLPYVGEVRRQIVVDRGRLYAVLGPQFSVEAPLEPRAINARLICLDVGAQEGKLLWSRAPLECLPDDAWRFSGPPLVLGSRLYISARRSRPALMVGVACIEAATGEPMWFQPVSGLLREPPRTHHLVTSDVLTAAQDRLVLASDFGATASLDLVTGRLEWVRRDEPQPWAPPSSVPPGEVAARPAVCHRGVVYAVGHDDRTVQALDAVTGARLWVQTVASPLRQIAGVHAGVVVAVGDHLWGLDVDTGTVRWRFGFDDVEGAFIGQAVRVGDSVYACTHDELWEIDLVSGEPLRRVPLGEGFGVAGGRLLQADAVLIVASDSALTALALVTQQR
jgi:outer membrane protein assembly factor BamB